MSRTLATIAAAAALAASLPRDTAAQAAQSWTVCTPGTFRSCHSVLIQTTPVMTGAVRTGTALTITLTNLQGSGLAGDNATHSGLMQVFFTARNLPTPMMFTDAAGFDGTLVGPGASGSLTNWGVYTEHFEVDGTTHNYLGLYGFPTDTDSEHFLGGCDTGPLVTGSITGQTCGAAARAVFSMTFDFDFDADQFEALLVQVASADMVHLCISDPSVYFEEFVECGPPGISTVPEPMTVILLGSGLAGIGGAIRRRRRRT